MSDKHPSTASETSPEKMRTYWRDLVGHCQQLTDQELAIPEEEIVMKPHPMQLRALFGSPIDNILMQEEVDQAGASPAR